MKMKAPGRLIDGVQRVAQGRVVALGRVGHGQAPVEAPKQGHAEMVLERFDLMADCGLGDEKLLCGLGEGEVTRRGLEGA